MREYDQADPLTEAGGEVLLTGAVGLNCQAAELHEERECEETFDQGQLTLLLFQSHT